MTTIPLRTRKRLLESLEAWRQQYIAQFSALRAEDLRELYMASQEITDELAADAEAALKAAGHTFLGELDKYDQREQRQAAKAKRDAAARTSRP